MSLMALGYQMSALKKGIESGRFSTKEQVKQAAEKMNISSTVGLGDLSPEDRELWYEQLATNVFDYHNNCIPCFADLGFGRELLERSSGMWNYSVPKKEHWKIIVSREKFPDWQFNGIVPCYTREEAVQILKVYFGDFGGIGFRYEDPTPKTENKAPWVEINSRKNRIKSYREYVEMKGSEAGDE